jgi:hypothetical protein
MATVLAVMPRLALLAVLLGAAACGNDDQAPRTFIAGPRVLAIKAEPPEVAAGGSATVTILVAGAPQGQAVTVAWSRCLLAPLPGQASNPDCVANPQAAYIEPIGDGTTITATMPADITADQLGQPDASGGVYLSLVARVTVAAESFAAIYRLRFGTGGNQNPVLTGVSASDAAGTTLLDEATPLAVSQGGLLTLNAVLAAGSEQSYVTPVIGTSGGRVTETVRTSWYSTAGDFSDDRTQQGQRTVLSLDELVPAVGSIIDLYAVAHEERGGVDFLHRTLRLE